MKFKISKAEYEKLSDEQKTLYTAKGDDYQLTIEGMPDFEGMQSKLNQLLDETKQAKKEKAEAEAKAKADAEEAARKNGNVEALEKSWGDRLAQNEEAHKAEIAKYHNQVAKLMVSNEAQALSSKLFGDRAALLQHHVLSRLTLEQGENGEFKTRVLDKNGKASAQSIDDLYKEFASDPAFKREVVSTKATGATGGLQTANTTQAERSRGSETLEERRERARAIAASDSDQ